MKLPFPITANPRETFLALKSRLESTFSWPMNVVPDVASLPNALQYDKRQVIVRDIDGAGNPGLATALDGAWYDQNWSLL